jgi:hypothetical protein
MAFIEAMQWKGKESFEELFKLANVNVNIKSGEENIAQIKILDRLIDINPDDYVIRFNHDKFCVCNSEIFLNTFSNIEEILSERNRVVDSGNHKNYPLTFEEVTGHSLEYIQK